MASKLRNKIKKSTKVKVIKLYFLVLLAIFSMLLILNNSYAFEFNVEEGELVELKFDVSDPDGDDFYVECFEPLDSECKWQTDFDDSGDYVSRAIVSDGDDEVEEIVLIHVENKNRAPEILDLVDKEMFESEKLIIKLNELASDLDGDKLVYSIDGAPAGSYLDGSIFSYVPDLLLLNKGESVEYNLVVTVSDGDLSDTSEFSIIVHHKNHAPIIHPYLMGENVVYVNEGELLVLYPNISDPDGDEIEVSYDGWMNSNTKEVSFEDSGEYVIYLMASDGEFVVDNELLVVVNEINDAPVMDDLINRVVMEGDELIFPIGVKDSDVNDRLVYSLRGLPFEKSEIKHGDLKNNLVKFDIPYNTVVLREEVAKFKQFFNKLYRFFGLNIKKTGYFQDYVVYVKATDSYGAFDEKNFTLSVYDLNQEPMVDSFYPLEQLIEVYRGDVVSFSVNANDLDGDNLDYTWSFGLFSKSHKGSNIHKRTFNHVGKKKVTVKIDDGLSSIKHTWDVLVREYN